MGQELQVRSVAIVGPRRTVTKSIRAGRRAGTIIGPTKGKAIMEDENGVVAVYVDMPVVRAAPKRTAEMSTGRSIAYALMWVCGLGAVGCVLLAVAIALIGGLASLAKIASVVGALVVLAMVAANRLAHSGACPGLHCSGCKG